jgi:hypothetical protein
MSDYKAPYHTYTAEETRGLPSYVIDIADEMSTGAGGGFNCMLDVFVKFQQEVEREVVRLFAGQAK